MRHLETLAPEAIPIASGSAFNDLIGSLDIRPARVLDVGAGGFLGETTTRYLLESFPAAEVVAVEHNEERAAALAEKYADTPRLSVVAQSFFDHESEPYDLVVLDLDSGLVPRIFSELLDGRVFDLLAPSGVVITVTITHAESSFDGGPRSLAPANRMSTGKRLEKIFGTGRIDDVALKSHFEGHPRYRAIVAVDKFRDDQGSPVGWLTLQRRP